VGSIPPALSAPPPVSNLDTQRCGETPRFIIYGFLKTGTYIQDGEKNQFALAEKGKQMLARHYAPPGWDFILPNDYESIPFAS
jgi:hypothetical protein